MAKVSGGQKLKSAIQNIVNSMGAGMKVRVGFLENSKYPDGTSVAFIAATQNWGAPAVGIPPRPFFSNMIKDESPSWPKKLAAGLKYNNYDAEKTLEQVGEDIAGALRESIDNTNSPPLKPKTIKRKGSSKPLVDSGLMRNSVRKEIVK